MIKEITESPPMRIEVFMLYWQVRSIKKGVIKNYEEWLLPKALADRKIRKIKKDYSGDKRNVLVKIKAKGGGYLYI